MSHLKYALWVFVGVFALIPAAYAYIGPGPGLSMLSSLFTLVGGVLVALFMVLLYPIRLFMKRRKAGKIPAELNQRPHTRIAFRQARSPAAGEKNRQGVGSKQS